MSTELVAGAQVEVAASPVDRFYAHGWHSWCRSGWVDPTARWRPIVGRADRLGHDDPVHAFDTDPGGSAVGAVDHGDGEVVLLGALDLGGWVSLQGDSLIGTYDDGERGRWLLGRGDHDQVFSAYADALAQRFGKRGAEMRLWCSWYSYYEDIDAERIEQVVGGLGDLPFDVVQIDDGWQRNIGDWRANDRFPAGLAPLARRIADSGRRAGLWLAPFIAAPDSEVATAHPEMLLCDEDGEPAIAGENWGGPYFALDVTHPATMSHLGDTIGRLTVSGFSFFKLDFVYAAAYPGRHHEPMGREAAYRQGLEVIRAAAGDAYLLACGAPIVASLGVCDGIRVGPDVAPWWVAPDTDARPTGLSARDAMATAVNRLWLRPVIDTDPDVVFFRSAGVTLDPPARRRMQQLAHIAGFRGVSDPPDWLTPAERAELAAFLAARPDVAHTSRYGWRVGTDHVDFADVADATLLSPGAPR